MEAKKGSQLMGTVEYDNTNGGKKQLIVTKLYLTEVLEYFFEKMAEKEIKYEIHEVVFDVEKYKEVYNKKNKKDQCIYVYEKIQDDPIYFICDADCECDWESVCKSTTEANLVGFEKRDEILNRHNTEYEKSVDFCEHCNYDEAEKCEKAVNRKREKWEKIERDMWERFGELDKNNKMVKYAGKTN